MASKEAKRTVRIFALASFLNDMGSDVIYPLWPLFLMTFQGMNTAILGFIDGIGEAFVSISQAFSGFLSDRIRKRKVFIWLGYLFGALSRFGYALSTTWHYIIPFRILDRSGKIRATPRDAIVADVSTKKERGKNFGILRAFDNLGAVTGITLSIFLVGILGYKKLFLLTAIPSLIGSFLIFLLIKERKVRKAAEYKWMSLKDLRGNFKLFLLASSVFAFGSFSYSFLLLYAKNFGFGIAFIPVLYLIFTAIASLFSEYFGRLSDRIGRKPVLFLSYIFWILVSIIFIFQQNYLLVIFAFVLYGFHKAAFEPAQKAFVAELSAVEFRASTLGLFQMIIGLIALPASFIAGMLWLKVNIFAPFYFSISVTIASMLALLFVKE